MTSQRVVAAVLIVLSLWAIVAPYSDAALGLDVNVRDSIEVVDHVVPGLVALLAAAGMVLVPVTALPGSLVALLAGLWMTATHLPLVAQAARTEVTVAATVWHTGPGVCLLALALAAAVTGPPTTPTSDHRRRMGR